MDTLEPLHKRINGYILYDCGVPIVFLYNSSTVLQLPTSGAKHFVLHRLKTLGHIPPKSVSESVYGYDKSTNVILHTVYICKSNSLQRTEQYSIELALLVQKRDKK